MVEVEKAVAMEAAVRVEARVVVKGAARAEVMVAAKAVEMVVARVAVTVVAKVVATVAARVVERVEAMAAARAAAAREAAREAVAKVEAMDSTQSSANGCGSRAYSTVSVLQFLDSLSRLQLYDVRASAFREWRQASNSQNSENSGFFQIITATRSRNSAVSRPLPLRRNSYYSSYF